MTEAEDLELWHKQQRTPLFKNWLWRLLCGFWSY